MQSRVSSHKPIIITLLVLVSVMTGVGNTQASLLTGLEANWRLDETSGTFADSSGNGNTGTAVGSPWGNGTNGLIDGAIDIDGNNWVEAGNIANYGINHSFSASMWVKLDANPTGFLFFLGQQSTAGGVAGWRLGNSAPDRSKVRLILQNGSGSSSFIESAAGVLNSSNWLHLAFSYNSENVNIAPTERMILYIDGVATSGDWLSELTNASNITTAADTNFSIGARDADGGGAVKGMIDEVGLWNRVLTQQEVTTLYNGGNGMQVVPEPSTAALLGLSVLGLTLMRRRRH